MSLSSAKKKRIWLRDKYICKYCFKRCSLEEVTVDHKIPKMKGGTNFQSNLVTCCRKCNLKKGQREYFVKYKK